MAIYESIRRRLERQQDLLKELEDLPPAQRGRRLVQLQGRHGQEKALPAGFH
jgi:hypothetical protein